MLSLIRPRDLTFEDVKDYRYAGVSSILLPSSQILIGTQGKLEDASLFSAGNLTFDFGNGTGDNGLDAGVEVSNQWYALYAVPKAGTSQYILKASVNSPHAAGGTGPVGFSKYRYLGIFRNGVNTYNSLAEHNPNDICLFTKYKNEISFQGYNTTNGGAYPKAQTHTGITLYVANTSLNVAMVNVNDPNYVGFTGASPSGGAKLPYRIGKFKFAHYINTVTGTSHVTVRDSGGNDRDYLPMSIESATNAYHGWFEVLFSLTDWQTVLFSTQSGNLNVNRGLLLQGFVDPFTSRGNIKWEHLD